MAKHFVAVSTNAAEVAKFGIDPENMFVFWDWVGGRYSLWSAIGLSDRARHRHGQLRRRCWPAPTKWTSISATRRRNPNLPLLLGLIGIWNANFLNAQSYAILPYDQYCTASRHTSSSATWRATASRWTATGSRVDHGTGPVVWGEPGTNGQHAFYQLIHQGTRLVPSDFLAPVETQNPIGKHHPILLSNFLAQTEALMSGKTAEEVRAELQGAGIIGEALEALVPHKVFEGNRPTNSILFPKLTPRTLGLLIALYEHKMFVAGDHLEHQLLRSVGRGAWQAACQGDFARIGGSIGACRP